MHLPPKLLSRGLLYGKTSLNFSQQDKFSTQNFFNLKRTFLIPLVSINPQNVFHRQKFALFAIMCFWWMWGLFANGVTVIFVSFSHFDALLHTFMHFCVLFDTYCIVFDTFLQLILLCITRNSCLYPSTYPDTPLHSIIPLNSKHHCLYLLFL
jgi:hypothetical protein